jgi:SOS-response transcriptional repressor LexA
MALKIRIDSDQFDRTRTSLLGTYPLRIKGDSMEPRFPDGAILLVEPDETPLPGKFVIVRQNGDEATFKQLIPDGSTLYLKPINLRYPIMALLPNSTFCGVVKRVEMDV